MGLLQTVQADGAITRLLNLCQRDIRRSVKGTLRVDETYWINLMMDRTALLLPRLQRSERAPEQALDRLLHALRLGLSVMHLRRSDAPPGSEVDALFQQINAADRHALRERIAALIERQLPAADEHARQFVFRLVDLHCALRGPDHG